MFLSHRLRPFIALFTLLLFGVSPAKAQTDFLSIKPKIGTRLYSESLPRIQRSGKQQVFSSLLVGVTISAKNTPWSISLEKDFMARMNGGVTPPVPNLGQYNTENSAHLRYDMNWGSVGLGFYHYYRETSNDYLLGSQISVRNYRGIYLSAAKSFDWLNIEYRHRLNLDPYFAGIVGVNPHNLVFTYNFNAPTIINRPKFLDQFDLSLNVGTRAFPIEGLRTKSVEEFAKVGFATTFGVEFMHKESNLSALIARDIWISLNGGSTERLIKGRLSSSFFGLRYHHMLKNGRYMRFGLGYSMIRDFDLQNQPITDVRFLLYQVKGVGILYSYEVIPNLDLEFKHTVSILSSNNESQLRPIRMSLGLIYRLRPGKDSEKQNSYF